MRTGRPFLTPAAPRPLWTLARPRFALAPLKSRILPPTRLSSTQTPPPPKAKAPTGFRALTLKYGKAAFVVYMAISTVDLSICYVAVAAGGGGFVRQLETFLKGYLGDWVSFGKRAEIKEGESSSGTEDSDALSPIGIFVVAYAIHKLLAPLRVAITAATTPAAVRWAVARGWMKPLPKIRSSPPSTKP
ncbi:hypothetical protein BJ684DRAFT_17457 [Piptocephalis cylindrospora]|uniref:DUF1279 domain-containing protein n=1 Tax=Piptocephalis cylindrospora TaxID=1907219 RepID=A0A4P9XZZ7_9FUNG|nr:hypothetical protein BJ684DRAFT_17457 [Piptocephalis cylindrospora]|eukprot:RKP12017.1 hypothetical protein BJ684DRAFT_17457 [Piptocephalis cylindrospora]